MNKNLPNTYQAYLSWRGSNIVFQQQSVGSAAGYSLAIVQTNPTNIKIECSADFSSQITFIITSYLLIHQTLITNLLMYGKSFTFNTACDAYVPVPDTPCPLCPGPSPCAPCTPTPNPPNPILATCNYPAAFAMPAAGYKSIVFLQSFKLYRDNNIINMLNFYTSVLIVDPNNINI